ncbi:MULTISPECIES: flavodoxin domain-containing protein [Paenibacillus]|uniref:flavodoxin domain-containing protein n=1 Tax=Paenibacillus TaxID=44249 RepID=UPI0009FA58CC|nr:flavodoxin domain-containing protein [Paenibacillus borealis]
MRNRTLIMYASKYGCTEKAAMLLKSRLGEAEVMNLKYAEVPALASYDTVILGSSIYFGKIRKEMALFTSKYQQELLNKRLGLFVCAGMTGEKAEEELKQAYSEVLYNKALAKEILGDEIDPEKISTLDRWILRMVKGKGHEAGAGLSVDKLDKFVLTMSRS